MFEFVGEVEVGDSLFVNYGEYIISKIITAEYYGTLDGYYIEFYDQHNIYHYYKQCFDGGRFAKKN